MQIQCTWTRPELRFGSSTLFAFSKHLKAIRARKSHSFVAAMSTVTTTVDDNQVNSAQNANRPVQVFNFRQSFDSLVGRFDPSSNGSWSFSFWLFLSLDYYYYLFLFGDLGFSLDYYYYLFLFGDLGFTLYFWWSCEVPVFNGVFAWLCFCNSHGFCWA